MDSPDKITFFASYYEALAEMEPDVRCAVYDAIFEYAFGGVEPDFGNDPSSAVKRMAWKLIKPNIDSTLDRGRTNASNAKGARRKSKTPKATATESESDRFQDEKRPLSKTKATAAESESDRFQDEKATISKDMEKDGDMEMEEEEDKRADALTCMRKSYPDAFISMSNAIFNEPARAIEHSFEYIAPPVSMEAFLGQIAKLCPPGCDAGRDKVKRCYQCIDRALEKYDPKSSASPYPLAAKIIADERGW